MPYPFAQPEQTVLVTAGPSSGDTYTLSSGDSVVRVNATYKPMTVILPVASSMKGYSFDIKRLNTNANAVTLQCSGTDTLDGIKTLVIPNPLDNIRIQSNGTNWDIKTGNITGARSTFNPTASPSLVLDFVNRKTFDSRLQFTRPSIATYVNSRGRIVDSANHEPRIDYDPSTGARKGLLIEKGITNFLPYSERFHVSTWTKGNVSVFPNQTDCPDGSNSGSLIMEDGSANQKFIAMLPAGVGSLGSGTYTLSVYAKAYTGAATRYVWLELLASGDVSHHAIFDLVNGTVILTNSGTISYITKYQNGWYRCGITTTTTGTPTSAVGIGNVAHIGSYQGNGLSGVYIWGAQLERNDFMSSYIKSVDLLVTRSSSASFYDSSGVLNFAGADTARYSYNPNDLTAPPQLLTENAATNLLLYSEDFSATSWSKNGLTAATGDMVSPNPNGTLTASLIMSTSVDGYVAQAISVSPSTRYTFSVWLRSVTPITMQLYIAEGANGASYTSCDVTSTWKRFSITKITSASTSVAYAQIGGNNSFPNGKSIYVWGGQFETGGPSSYIKTVGSSVTRANESTSTTVGVRSTDICLMPRGPWYNPTEGTLMTESSTHCKSNYPATATLDIGGRPENRISLFYDPSFKRLAAYYRKDSASIQGGTQTSNGTTVSGEVYRMAMSFKNGYFRFAGADQLMAEDTQLKLPTSISRITVGDGDFPLNGHLLKLKYYPAVVSGDELRGLSQ